MENWERIALTIELRAADYFKAHAFVEFTGTWVLLVHIHFGSRLLFHRIIDQCMAYAFAEVVGMYKEHFDIALCKSQKSNCFSFLISNAMKAHHVQILLQNQGTVLLYPGF